MQAPVTSHPSVSSANSYEFCLPPYKSSYMRRYHPYPRPESSRRFIFHDPLMRTLDTRYDGPRLDHLVPIIEEEQTDEDRIGLHDAVASKDATARARHFNLSAIVAYLILAIRQRLERLHIIHKEN